MDSAQAQPLLHALGQPANRLVGQPIQAREAHRVFDSLMSLAAHESVGAGEEIQVLVAVHIRIRAEIVGHEAEPTPYEVGIVHHRESVDECIAVGGQIQRGQNAHAGGFAGAVGADVAEHFAPRHFERDIAHGARAAEVAVQPPQLDRRTGG